MNDIQKMIEEEAEKKYLNLDDEDFLDFSDEEKLKAFKSGANFVLHANRWRKVSEELPEMSDCEYVITYQITKTYRNLACKDAQGRVYIKNRISIDDGKTWNWQFEYRGFEVTEWKPID